jgi:hypothetical protein
MLNTDCPETCAHSNLLCFLICYLFIFSGNREEKEDWISAANRSDSESNSGHLSYSAVT